MDDTAFDRFARLLGRPGSRRAALATLVSAGVLGATEHASAKKHRHRKKGRVTAAAKRSRPDCEDPGPGKDLTRCDFTGADLTRVNLKGADLSGANFEGADLRGANLKGADLGGTNFKFTNLCAAHLNGASLQPSNLTRALLRQADLRGAKMRTEFTDQNSPLFCQTIMPDGDINNSDCPDPSDPSCCFNEECSPVFDTPRICDFGFCCIASGVTLPPALPDFLCCSGAAINHVCL